MIKFESVHLQRGVRFLLQDANLVIHSQQKIGLIGANGTGKTSFFKLILGELHEDAGQVSLPKNWLISHMAQELDDSELSALDFVLSGDEALCRLHEQMLVLEGEALARVYESIEAIDGYTADTRAHKLLVGLGFSAEDAKKPVSSFSGGWRIRLNLARALMCRSDLLLLDEPTNHLDLDATVWLEQWLQNYNGTLLIISHDRDFLDSVVGHIVHLENQILATYMGNYSSFEVQRADRLSQQAQAFNKQQARISEIESFVRRFKAKATKAKQAQSRIKELDRMQKVAAVHVETPFDFKFPKPEKLPQTLLSVSDATVGYHTPIVENIQMTVLSNSRVGLLGRNGSGKSTLLKALAGATHLLNGDRVEAQHLKIGYYS